MPMGKLIEPTAEMRKVLGLCIEWYSVQENACGGSLHVILDDDNVNDEDLVGVKTSKRGMEIVDALKSLTVMQRKWVTYNIYNVKDGEGERDIHDEFECFECGLVVNCPHCDNEFCYRYIHWIG